MQIVINEEQIVRSLERLIMSDVQNRDGIMAREVLAIMREAVRSTEFDNFVKNAILGMLPKIVEGSISESIETAVKTRAASIIRRMSESGEMAEILRKALEGKS